jgi:hypothetical protein
MGEWIGVFFSDDAISKWNYLPKRSRWTDINNFHVLNRLLMELSRFFHVSHRIPMALFHLSIFYFSPDGHFFFEHLYMCHGKHFSLLSSRLIINLIFFPRLCIAGTLNLFFRLNAPNGRWWVPRGPSGSVNASQPTLSWVRRLATNECGFTR